MAAKIGIKLADGSFVPIMDEDFSASETLELTTVRDDQRSVQINLFKKEDDISDPSYIGSLIVEDIHEKSAGEPTIELRLALDDTKNLSAEAVDKDSGSRQALKVSLETFADQSFDNLDFDLSAETADADIDLTAGSFDSETADDRTFSAASFYTDEEDAEEPEKKHGLPVWLLVLLILLGVGALILGILLLTKKGLTDEDTPTASSEHIVIVPSTSAPQTPPAPEPQQPAPALPPDTSMTEPPKPADTPMDGAESDDAMANADTNMPPSEPAQPAMTSPATTKSPLPAPIGQAIRYKLRWGDTLWDISETYYRNPWLYTKIAEHNKLKNPDWVISGTYIEIPPQ